MLFGGENRQSGERKFNQTGIELASAFFLCGLSMGTRPNRIRLFISCYNAATLYVERDVTRKKKPFPPFINRTVIFSFVLYAGLAAFFLRDYQVLFTSPSLRFVTSKVALYDLQYTTIYTTCCDNATSTLTTCIAAAAVHYKFQFPFSLFDGIELRIHRESFDRELTCSSRPRNGHISWNICPRPGKCDA